MTETARADDAGPASSDVVPGIGTALSAVTMAAMLVPVRQGVDDPVVWAGAAFAFTAVLAFLVRRHGGLERRIGGPIAAGSSVAVLLLSGYALNQGVAAPVTIPAVSWTVSLLVAAFVTAGITAGLGVADYYGIGGAGLKRRSLQTVSLTLVGVLGLVAAQAAMVVLVIPMYVFGSETLSQMQLVVVSQTGMALGTAAVAAGYFVMTDTDLSFLDVRLPTKRDLLWTVGGLFVLFGALFAISVLMQTAGVESAEHSTTQQAQENPEMLLALIPLAILIIGPFEEFLYRNVVQKSLYETFSRGGAIVVASVIFASVHALAYGTSGVGQVIASLATIFGLSLVLGTIYERTKNLLVPALVHGVYNALIFANLYFMYG